MARACRSLGNRDRAADLMATVEDATLCLSSNAQTRRRTRHALFLAGRIRNACRSARDGEQLTSSTECLQNVSTGQVSVPNAVKAPLTDRSAGNRPPGRACANAHTIADRRAAESLQPGT